MTREKLWTFIVWNMDTFIKTKDSKTAGNFFEIPNKNTASLTI